MKSLPFWRRPWGAHRVLEVGGGHDPYFGVTHAVDKFPENDSQRGGQYVLPPGAKFFTGELESLPFPHGESFDFLYASHVFEHVRSPEKAVQEINRFVRRGYIETPSPLREQLACPIPYDAAADFHTYFCWFVGNSIHLIPKNENTIGEFTGSFEGKLARKLFQIQREEGIDLEPLLPRPAKTSSLYFKNPLGLHVFSSFAEAEKLSFCPYLAGIQSMLAHLSFPLYLRSRRFVQLRRILSDRGIV